MKNSTLKWMYQPNNGVYAELAPITSMKEFWECEWQLRCVFEHADQNSLCNEQLLYRGDCSSRSLGDKRWVVSAAKLRKVFDLCRREKLMDCGDAALYLLMRHAEVKYTALLDWTLSPEIAVWFAIHDRNGKLKNQANDDAVLWVFRPVSSDEAKRSCADGELFPEDGGSKSVVFFPYEDPREFEGQIGYVSYQRPTMQFAAEMRLRFGQPDRNEDRHLLPMDEDVNFKGRLLKIGIEGDFEAIDAELTGWLRNEQHWKEGGFREFLGLVFSDNDYVIPRALREKLNAEFENEVWQCR